MAQIPTSNIKPRLIYNEINGTSHGTDATIGSGVTMESLRTSSNAYTSGTYSGGTPDVQATPDRMSEWNGYAHAVTFTGANVPTYSIRTTTAAGVTSDYALLERTVSVAVPQPTCTAEGGIFLTTSTGSGYTKVWADVMKEADLDDLDDAELDYSRKYAADNSYVALGSEDNNTNPTEIINIPVAGVTVTMGGEFISGNGTGFPDADVTGEDTTLIAGSAKGAVDAVAATSGFPAFQTKQAWFRYDLTISKSGYTSASLTPFVSWSYHRATAEI